MIFTRFIFLKKKRLGTVLFNSLYSISNILWTVITSYIVIDKTSVDLWGEFMAIVAIISLGSHLVKWGNKTYLIREFSKKPNKIRKIWNQVFYARSPIYILISVACIFLYTHDFSLSIFILLWILGDYVFFSIESLIVYFKKFKPFFLLDLTLILISTIMLFLIEISVSILIIIYSIRTIIRALFSMIIFKKQLSWKFQNPNISLLKEISPFFLIGLIGLLNSKLDFYATLYYLSSEDIGKYHILSNFVLFGITMGSYIIVPFEKNIYRINKSKISKIAYNFLILGILISCSWMFVSKIIISKIYMIELPNIIFLIGIIYILPIYYYWPILHKLYSENKTISTIKVGVLSVITNAIFIFILLPKYGITGALISAAAGQVVHLIGYLILSKKNATRK